MLNGDRLGTVLLAVIRRLIGDGCRIRTNGSSFVIVELKKQAVESAKLDFRNRGCVEQCVQTLAPVVRRKDGAAQIAQQRRPHDARNMCNFLIDQSVHAVPRQGPDKAKVCLHLIIYSSRILASHCL
ncbi:hypothetical protein BN2476_910002 [Paraburkholderia piptadeniae]|uniref:Uncharacterized protein n=1 Tax=Paraburkholderia piptadeniae TaxID=1701573 RepID=A0A1N7ST64_9BURK|nr:hypothetical protein BN2476_910002 [Paraburkholderia piptadeniae]